MAIITKAWARDLDGTNGAERVVGLAHMIAASTAFGYLSMTAKDLAKGKNQRHEVATRQSMDRPGISSSGR